MATRQKTGGRQKGVRNKRTVELQAKIEASGLTPLDYMLSVMRDPTETQAVRLKAAADAAPYVHARLQAIQHTGDLTICEISPDPLTEEQWSEEFGAVH